MTTVFHAWPYGRFIEIQSNPSRRKPHRTNQGSNFLRVSFSNKDNLRFTFQFRREKESPYLKTQFFFKKRPIHFHINSTRVIRPVKQNKLWDVSQMITKTIPVHRRIVFGCRIKRGIPF